jgi:hypothetical protein
VAQGYRTDLLSGEHGELAASLSSERQSTHCIFSKQQSDAYLERLDSSVASSERLRDYYNDFNEVSEPDAGLAMMDSLRALRQSLSEIDDASRCVADHRIARSIDRRVFG